MTNTNCTRASHEALKLDRARWEALRLKGVQEDPEGDLELRNCDACGSTLAIEMQVAA